MKYLAAESQLDAHDLKCSIGNWGTYSRATGRSRLLVKKMPSIPVLSTTKFKQLFSNGFINFIWIRIKTNPFIFQLKIFSEEKFILLLLSPQRNPSGKDGNIWRSWLRVKGFTIIFMMYSKAHWRSDFSSSGKGIWWHSLVSKLPLTNFFHILEDIFSPHSKNSKGNSVLLPLQLLMQEKQIYFFALRYLDVRITLWNY